MRAKTDRSGYAMMLVLVFIVLFLSFWSIAYRQTAAALRIECTQVLQRQRDEGSIHALARALALLETGLPPTDPYVCGVTIDTSTGERSYAVTFSSEGENHWSVQAAPPQSYERPLPMPDSFAPMTP